MNKVFLIGNVGKDPEQRATPTGDIVGNFTLATSRKWKDKNTGQKREVTAWHNITTWGKLAELCLKYLQKGSKCAIVGEIEYQSWEKDGQKHYKTVIRANEVEFLSAARQEGPPIPTQDDDGMPF